MKATIIVAAIVFAYAILSTFFRDTAIAGNIGKSIGDTNIYLFGYFAYINIALLFYPLYRLYKDEEVRKSLDFYLGWLLFFIAIILLEGLLFESENAGIIGTQIVSFLLPYIGKVGVWLLWLMVISLVFIFALGDEFIWKMPQVPNTVKRKEQSLYAEEPVASEDIYAEPHAKEPLGEKVSEGVAKVAKTLMTNPFASPRLEDEMMPLHTQKSATQPSQEPKEAEEEINTSAQADLSSIASQQVVESEEIEDPVLEEIMEFEPPLEPVDQVKKPQELKSPEAPKTVAKTKKEVEEKSAKNSGVQIVNELEENSKLMQTLERGKVEKPKNFKLPKLEFLQKAPKLKKRVNEAEIDKKSGNLLEKLKLFNINGDIVRTYTGPLVTTFEFKPAPNVKVSKILGLQDDLAMALSAETIRIQAPIPGRDVVGIEIPNENRDIIYLREILESELFQTSSSPLTIALGKDIVGKPFITDIKKLPHLLIAGTTGSGKSVGINAMILSLLYKNDPEHLKLMMIDPKMLEFSIYDDIPHLITPVITEPKKAIAALANMVGEMERRYRLMADKRTKNIDNYNEKVKKDGSAEPMPFIVIIIDELADLMMNGGKEVENSIARLAQKSSACGIHLIVATQRPSVDVVTGIIKANLPSRLSYRVGQKIDSKVILDSTGAESLLGRGDGLFTPPGTTGLVRIHAPWATEEEIEKIVEFIKAQRAPEYDESYLIEGGGATLEKGEENIDLDPLYEEAKAVVLSDKKTSISYLQRKLQIGYNRSANIIEQLQAMGVLSEPNAKGNREILE